MEGLFHDPGQLAHILDQEVVLDDGPGDAHRVTLLKGIKADGSGRHLPGDDHHGDAVHIGRGNPGHRVGHARAGCHKRYAHLASGTRIAVGRMDRRLLVAYQHMLHLVLLVQGVVDVEDGATGVAPDELNLFLNERAHEDFGAHDFGVFGGGSSGAGQFRLGDFHDKPLRFSLTKNLRCPSEHPCGAASELKA